MFTLNNSSVICLGKQGSGKTFLLKSYIRAHNQIWRDILILTGSEFTGEYQDLLVYKNVKIMEFDINIVSGLIQLQKERIQKFPDTNNKILLVWEDFIASIEGLKKTEKASITKLSSYSRHLHISSWMNCQRVVGILPTSLRSNVLNYIFISQQNTEELKTLFQNVPNCNISDSVTFFNLFTSQFFSRNLYGFCHWNRAISGPDSCVYYTNHKYCEESNKFILYGRTIPPDLYTRRTTRAESPDFQRQVEDLRRRLDRENRIKRDGGREI